MKNNQALWCVFVVLASVGFVLSACQMAHMALPDTFPSSMTPIQVSGQKGFGSSLAMGPFEVKNIQRGWKSQFSWGVAVYGRSRAKQQYGFELLDTRNQVVTTANCANGAKWQELKDQLWGGELTWGLTSEAVYLVAMKQGDHVWEMAMAEDGQEWVLMGRLSDGKTVIEVAGTKKLAGSSWPSMEASGYVFTKDGKEIGAVEVVNNGRLWVSPDLDEGLQSVLAASSASLLLYRDLRD
ncbi:MAG: hypothetical protein V2A34_13540 [Lentisphaerota bacterium]